MLIKKTDKLPTKGQFGAYWINDGKIWTRVFKWDRDQLLEYENDEFIEVHEGTMDFLNDGNKTFLFLDKTVMPDSNGVNLKDLK